MAHDTQELTALRERMTRVNTEIMGNLNTFFTLSNAIGQVKDHMGLPHFDPVRESEMLSDVLAKNTGPMPHDLMKRIFKEIFNASVEEMGVETRRKLQVNRLPGEKDQTVTVGETTFGGGQPVLIAGPCSVENYDQIYTTAKTLREYGVRVLRGGAFKPRTSPYSFQGLEEEALKILRNVADEFGMIVVSEVVDTKDIALVGNYVDIFQVGTRNMFNYALLKELGHADRPVVLKRSFMATIDEFIQAAEYIYIGGNQRVILCERGIRTFETQTRNTLDISSIPILKQETSLPVLVDISHSLGRKDIVTPIAHAALAAGADGLMVEAHFNPTVALSDAAQQLDMREMKALLDSLVSRTKVQHSL